MALNFSHRPMFSTHRPDENLVSPMRISNGYGGDLFDIGGSQDPVSRDILDILPSDPFNMDISTTVTAITGWLEDLEVVDYGGYGGHEIVGIGTSDGSYNLFAELNLFLNQAMRFQGTFPGFMDGGFGFGLESSVSNTSSSDPKIEDFPTDNVGDLGSPHGALSYALAHLGMRDLLTVERVCKSLRSAVIGDSLLWRNIQVDEPSNEKITDDVLLQLTNRAQGNLHSLSLVECPRITDDGLRRVLETNPKLTKLSVAGSTRLSIEGIINTLKASKSMGAQGVKGIRVGGLYGITMKHFEELIMLLGSHSSQSHRQNLNQKPYLYSRGNLYLPCDDDRDIDIEPCPRCQNLRLVYDCPLNVCQETDHASRLCRACTLCIPRCAECGRCFVNNEFEETFCLELLCSVCVNQMVSADDAEVEAIEQSPGSSSAHD